MTAGTSPATGRTAAPVRPATGWLDLARVVAIVAVVMVHVVVPVMAVAERGDPAWWIAAGLNAASRWCVPVFLMVSGALLLEPSRSGPVGAFYLKRLRRVGVPLVVWTAFYLWYREAVRGEDIGPEQVLQLVASGEPFLQLYFLYVVAGLTLLTPFLRLVTRNGSRETVTVMAAVFFAIAVLNQALMSFVPVGGTNALTIWVPYVGYYVAGWVLRDTLLRGAQTVWAVVVLASTVVATTLWALVLTDYVFSYATPLVVVMSLAALLLLHRVGERLPDGRGGSGGSVLRWMSDLSFGVFLVHPVFLDVLRELTGLPTQPGPLLGAIALQLVVAVLASALVAAVARRVPLLREVF